MIDIRVPIGAMFTILGVILLAYGALSGPEIYARSLGINVNLIWGAVVTAFGLGMLYFGRRAGKMTPP